MMRILSRITASLTITIKIFTDLICLWLVGFCVFLLNIPNDYPNLQSGQLTPRPIDAIVALTGGHARTKCAISLLEKKYAPTLFISGASKCVVLKDLAIYMNDKNLSYQNTFLGHEASNTIGNAIEIKQFIHKHKFKSVILVTSDYHILRSLLLLRHVGISAEIIPYPVLPRKRRGFKWLALASREYNAILYFFSSMALNKLKFFGNRLCPSAA